MFAVNKIQLNNLNAVSFKGVTPNNSPFVILPLDPKERENYINANKNVLGKGYAEGGISFSQLLARKIVAFWKLVTQDPVVAKQAKQLENEIRDIVTDDTSLGNKVDLAA